MGESLLENVYNFPNNYECWRVKLDINKHYFYGLTIPGSYTIISILRAHENEHKKDFEELYEKHKEYYLNTAQLLLKSCKEFIDENAAKAYYEPIIREVLKQIYRTAYNDFIKLGGPDNSLERLDYERNTNLKIYSFIDALMITAELIYCQ